MDGLNGARRIIFGAELQVDLDERQVTTVFVSFLFFQSFFLSCFFSLFVLPSSCPFIKFDWPVACFFCFFFVRSSSAPTRTRKRERERERKKSKQK